LNLTTQEIIYFFDDLNKSSHGTPPIGYEKRVAAFGSAALL
jgi:hypothetical protein